MERLKISLVNVQGDDSLEKISFPDPHRFSRGAVLIIDMVWKHWELLGIANKALGALMKTKQYLEKQTTVFQIIS